MAHQINPHQQKLAEKLTILNDRGIGMLTRIFNIKKVKFLIDERQLTFERREEIDFLKVLSIFRHVRKRNLNHRFSWIKISNLYFVRYKKNFQRLIKYVEFIQ
jgi:hypothetical protein